MSSTQLWCLLFVFYFILLCWVMFLFSASLLFPVLLTNHSRMWLCRYSSELVICSDSSSAISSQTSFHPSIPRFYFQPLQNILFFILLSSIPNQLRCASLSTESPGKQLHGLETSSKYIFDHTGYMWSYMSLQIRLMTQFPVLISDHAHSVAVSLCCKCRPNREKSYFILKSICGHTRLHI